MRLVHFPTFWTILLDFAAWFVIHMGVVLAMVSLPVTRFDPDARIFRPRPWEEEGALYRRVFRIRKWKGNLPDGSRFFRYRGFYKTRMEEVSPEYMIAFMLETCRAELTHWVIMLFAPLFFLWNPLWVGFFMILYAAVENLPLIMAQRYNRLRLRRFLRRKGWSPSDHE